MRTKHSKDIETPIASLIDIVFLLIIFFVVTSEIEKDAVDESINLAETNHIDPVTKKDPRTITINLKRIKENRTLLKIATVPLSLTDLTAILKNTIVTYGNTVPVVLRADGDISYSEINRVIDTVTQAGLFRVKLASRDKNN